MKHASGWFLMVLALALAPASSQSADRAIVVQPTVRSSWGFATPGGGASLRPRLAVGFWQRSSGAAKGVGANYISALEHQLPEAAPQRVRSASLQFSGTPWQCSGAEPVVIDVYAYAADGKADASDAHAGTRVAQLSADCTDKNAFARPIDVSAIVRQQSVASGIRYVGFNIRKANNRQGPGLFSLTPGKLTVVLSDTAVVTPAAPMARAPSALPATPGAAPVPMRAPQPMAATARPAPQAHAASAARATLLQIRQANQR